MCYGCRVIGSNDNDGFLGVRRSAFNERVEQEKAKQRDHHKTKNKQAVVNPFIEIGISFAVKKKGKAEARQQAKNNKPQGILGY